ncbi:hypothetical protein HYDPIDRAFT_116458 [Hydnomerulius pinastri MD-312]|uniref:Borealin N-terminal domain-containing protein n=1 Tax=Hydnomerulius pinastri MD-312 TaxID=994086 RepID=A0A0C9VTA6_9AGAM|nr:hypothetical protein HYDPIDRAFT_116458 [Hydnomerulius pinastri MD-312]
MKIPDSTRKYTPEEKQQLIKNLDIEVEHRVRQLEEWLAVALENFRLHQEGLISRIPKLVRGVSMGEFADKYNGDIQACLRGLQSERMGGAGALEIDRDTRKRKWAASQEEVEGTATQEGSEPVRAAKNARMMAATPKKKLGGGPSNTQQPPSRAFSVARTPGAVRTTTSTRPPIPPSPSPQKHNKPPSFVPVRGPSPSKPLTTQQRTRPPSSATFNPTMLPPKAPTYPALRAPRRDESMLSVNGSPLANPYLLGLGWFAGGDEDAGEEGEEHNGDPKGGKGKGKDMVGTAQTLPRVNSIVIRRDPSVTLPSSQQTNGTSSRTHSRANSQSTIPHSTTHSRTNSRSQLLVDPPATTAANPAIPNLLSSHPSASALISLPTSDGHLLEFDPLTTSPRALESLVGISESAKKQAREEMGRLVREAVRKWVIE